MLNRVTLIGNLTRDAESITGSQTTMTRLRLATNAYWRDAQGVFQQSTEYHSVVAFGGLAERCGTSCTRGRRVYVEGRLRTREYAGGDGLRRMSTEIVADTVRMLDRVRSVDDDVDEEEDGDELEGTRRATQPEPAVAG